MSEEARMGKPPPDKGQPPDHAGPPGGPPGQQPPDPTEPPPTDPDAHPEHPIAIPPEQPPIEPPIDPGEPPVIEVGELLTAVIEHADGRVISVLEEHATQLDGAYVDPEGAFIIRRRVYEVDNGYRVLFDRHDDGSRWSVGFEYADPFRPTPWIAGIEEDADDPQSVLVRTTEPHGLTAGASFQLRGTTGASELLNLNFAVANVVDDHTFIFDAGRDTFTPWTKGGWINPGDLGPHTVTILEGGVVLQQVDTLQVHYYGARWRRQSRPLPVRHTFQDLVASGFLPNFDSSAVQHVSKTYNKHPDYVPMRLNGTTPYQPQTGGRGDIGPIMRWTADLMQDASMQDTVIAQAESHGTYPWCWRDPNTQAPFNVLEYPTATSYGSKATNTMYVGRATSKYDGGTLMIDAGHSPAMLYVPFLQTRDPWYLEGLQMQSMIWLLMQPHTTRYNLNGRYAAWSCRDALMAALATPAQTPSWLLPKSVMDAVLQGYLDAWTDKYRVHGDATQKALHLQTNYGSRHQAVGQPSGSYDAPWCEDYITIVACWAAQHRPEWREHAEWIAYGTVQRLNGTSGWPRAVPNPYMANVTAGSIIAYPGVDGQTTGNVINADDAAPFEINVDQTLGWPIYASPFKVWMRKVEWMTGELSGDKAITILSRAQDGTKAVAHGNGAVAVGVFATTYEAYGEINKLVQPAKIQGLFHPDDPTGNELLSPTFPIDNISFAICAAGMAASTGVAGARECYDWIWGQMLSQLAANRCPFTNYLIAGGGLRYE
jgi:hypothetical protein